MDKIYIVEERIYETTYDGYEESTEYCAFETLDKAQSWVGERVSTICKEGHFDMEQIHVDETYACGVIDIPDHQFIIRELEVK